MSLSPATTAAPAAPAVTPLYRGGSFFGLLRDAHVNQLDLFTRIAADGDVVRFGISPRQSALLLVRPEHIQHVLVDNHRNYFKQTRGYHMLRLVLGNGLLTSEGAFWRRQRRIMQPAFHRARLEGFASVMTRVTGEMLDAWAPAAAAGAALDVAREMMALTLRIVCLTMLSRDVTGAADRVGEAVTIGLEHLIYRIRTPWSLPERIPTPRNTRFGRAARDLDRVIHDIIAERRGGGRGAGGDAGGSGDLLDMLIEARDEETGESMTDDQLRDEVMTIFIAGHETTANALTWTLYLLALHEDVEAALRAEVTSALARRVPTVADLRSLALTERVLKEAMRLYPPAWIVARRAEAADVVGGHRVRAGDFVFMSPWVTHRSAHVWPDPERFDPDRFLPEREAALPRFAYFPFSGGQRKCIGDGFAMMEARLLLAMIVQRVRARVAPGQHVEPEPMVTLRPRNGLTMRVEPA